MDVRGTCGAELGLVFAGAAIGPASVAGANAVGEADDPSSGAGLDPRWGVGVGGPWRWSFRDLGDGPVGPLGLAVVDS